MNSTLTEKQLQELLKKLANTPDNREMYITADGRTGYVDDLSPEEKKKLTRRDK